MRAGEQNVPAGIGAQESGARLSCLGGIGATPSVTSGRGICTASEWIMSPMKTIWRPPELSR
jgi:hypothetical protein